MPDPRADADLAAAHVVEWAKGARAALSEDKLTPTERARLGDLVLNAAQWLDERATRIAKEEKEAKRAAFTASIANLPHEQRLARIRQGF